MSIGCGDSRDSRFTDGDYIHRHRLFSYTSPINGPSLLPINNSNWVGYVKARVTQTGDNWGTPR